MRVEEFLTRVRGTVRKTPRGWECRCPAHDDQHASLGVAVGEDGRTLVYCQAGCTLEQICTATGCTVRDLFEHPREAVPEVKQSIVATYDYIKQGVLRFQSLRYGPRKDFRQRAPDGNGGWNWSLKGVERCLYREDELRAADPKLIRVVAEGEKDCNRLWSIGLPATCNPGGAGKWGVISDTSALDGSHLVVIADKDAPGRKHAVEVATREHRRGKCASIRIIELPDRGSGTVKDASDWIDAGGTADELVALAMAAPIFDPDSHVAGVADAPLVARDRPQVMLGADEPRVVDAVIRALEREPDLYYRGTGLARVVREPGQRAAIQSVPKHWLRERIALHVELQTLDKQGEAIQAHPPDWLVEAIRERGAWPRLRRLVGVTDAPVLRPDGTVHQVEGHDGVTGMLYEPEQAFPAIQPGITIDDAESASERLLELVCDFPFEASSHRSAWLAGLLTAVARTAIDGPVPLFLVDANVRGAGKGLLVQVIATIALGHQAGAQTYTHEGEELRKLITSMAMTAEPFVYFDNLTGQFGNAALDSALTSTRWKDRVLGGNAIIDLPLSPSWFATGNNVELGGDLLRRTLHVRLDLLSERPEQRSGFRIPSLLAHVTKHRARLYADAVTVVAAWMRSGIASGAPGQVAPLGSYEAWSRVVRDALLWLDLPDPVETQAALMERADAGVTALGDLLRAWRAWEPSPDGVSIGDLIRRLYGKPDMWATTATTTAQTLAMRDALEAFVGAQPERPPSARRLACKLREARRRVVEGNYVDVVGRSGECGRLWAALQSV